MTYPQPNMFTINRLRRNAGICGIQSLLLTRTRGMRANRSKRAYICAIGVGLERHRRYPRYPQPRCGWREEPHPDPLPQRSHDATSWTIPLQGREEERLVSRLWLPATNRVRRDLASAECGTRTRPRQESIIPSHLPSLPSDARRSACSRGAVKSRGTWTSRLSRVGNTSAIRHNAPASHLVATRGHPLAHGASARVAERKTSDRPANRYLAEAGQGGARGNSRKPSQSLFRWSERNRR